MTEDDEIRILTDALRKIRDLDVGVHETDGEAVYAAINIARAALQQVGEVE